VVVAAPIPGPTFSLSVLGKPTHAPGELWGRARKLGAAGFDVVLTRSRLPGRSADALDGELPFTAKIAPVSGVPGIAIASMPPGSIARAAGLQEGDLITAVNGHAISSPDAALSAYSSLRHHELAVVELRRGGRLVVLKIGWGKDRR